MTAAATGTHEQSRLIVFVVTVVCVLALTHSLVNGAALVWLALIAIAVGIWHGAFDGVLAEDALKPLLGRRWGLVFYPVYLLLAALVLAFWWTAPVWALSAFLLYSALHFGTEGETEMSPWHLLAGVSQGALPIAAACSWWPLEVSAIFRPMLEAGHGSNLAAAAVLMTHAAGLLLWPAVTVCLVSAWLGRRRSAVVPFILVFAELALFRFCSPVAAFAVFFCAWHTPEHLVSTSLDAAGAFQPALMISHLRKGMAPWLLSLVGYCDCVFGRSP